MKKYSIGEVYTILGVEALSIKEVNKKSRTNVEVDGFQVYRESLRYATFYQTGTKCVCCGREGSYFVLSADKDGNNADTRRHFNLYSEDGVLMTKDHIRPKKLGGKDHIDNMQTMCEHCNKLKGSKYDIAIPTIVGVNIDNENDIVKYLTIEDAVFSICERKHIYRGGYKPGKFARRMINETLDFIQVLDENIPYCNRVWSTQNLIWDGESYKNS